MPPKIKMYSNKELTEIHSGDFHVVDAGTEKEMSIYIKNEGNGTLLNMEVPIIKSDDSPLTAELLNTPPRKLKPNDVWEAKVRWIVDRGEKHGGKAAEMKVRGKYID